MAYGVCRGGNLGVSRVAVCDQERQNLKEEGGESVMVVVPKAILRGVLAGVSFVISGFLVGVLLKSVADAWRSLGAGGFLLLCGMVGGAVYVYSLGGWVQGINAFIAVLFIHVLMWSIGYYKLE
ncbi:hypothetical protein D1872_51900 [compost metagenome]